MNYKEKLQFVEQFILTGLTIEEAMIYAEMTKADIEKAKKDDNFLKRIEFLKIREYQRLMELYNKTAERAAEQKDDWRAAISLLENRYPNKFKNKSNNENNFNDVQIYLPDNKRKNKK